MVRKREKQFDLETVRQELNRHIGLIFAKQRFELVVRLFKERGDNANTRRNRNNPVFVCADRLQVDTMLRKARTTLALRQTQ